MTSLEYCTAVLGDKNIILDEEPKNGIGEGVVRGVSPLYHTIRGLSERAGPSGAKLVRWGGREAERERNYLKKEIFR